MRQILADLALSQVANKRVEYLNGSERRRLAIGNTTNQLNNKQLLVVKI